AELPAVAVLEPGDRRGDRHPPVGEQGVMMHGDDQPLRMLLPIDTAKLRDVGVDRQLLTRYEQVRVDNRRLDHRPAVEPPGRLDESFAVEKRLDSLVSYLGSIGVRLAEIVRASGEH